MVGSRLTDINTMCSHSLADPVGLTIFLLFPCAVFTWFVLGYLHSQRKQLNSSAVTLLYSCFVLFCFASSLWNGWQSEIVKRSWTSLFHLYKQSLYKSVPRAAAFDGLLCACLCYRAAGSHGTKPVGVPVCAEQQRMLSFFICTDRINSDWPVQVNVRIAEARVDVYIQEETLEINLAEKAVS